MLLQEARRLQVGDSVFVRNGAYDTKVTVTKKELHKRGGFWISYKWTRKGEEYTGRKRHVSVYLQRR